MYKKFQGIFVAITTFYKNARVDEESLKTYVSWLLEQNLNGILVCGTTGESLALSMEEQWQLIQLCGRLCKQHPTNPLLIAGVASPTLAQTLALALQAEKAGADALLAVTPYYVRPSQEGLIDYYTALHDQTTLPLIPYNNPSRACVGLNVESVRTLANQCPRMIGLKDSSSDLQLPLALKQVLPETFLLISGDDLTFPAFLAHGGHGAISVAAGVAPKSYLALYEAWKREDLKTYATLRDTLFPLAQALFETTSPGPLKYLLAQEGFGTLETRLPISFPSPSHQKKLQEALRKVREMEKPSMQQYQPVGTRIHQKR